MIICNKTVGIEYNESMTVMRNGTCLDKVAEIKRVLIDINLNMHSHAQNHIRKVSKH